MTIKLLRTLVAVADTRTFSAAAELVHVTHAAVSQQMQTLEANLGVALFNRTTRTPELTPVARQIVAKARVLLADYDNLLPSVVTDGKLTGTLKLGALRTTLTSLTPKAMAVFKDSFPQVGLHISPGLTGALLSDLIRGNLDAAVVSKPHLLPVELVFFALVTEPLQLIAAANEAETNPFELLRTKPFIRFDRNAVLGTVIDNWLVSNSIVVHETMELDSPEAISSMVQANLGVSIVPKLAVPPETAVPLKKYPLGDNFPSRTLGLVCRKDRQELELTKELLGAFQSVIASTQGT